ncbi:TetR/AcrR family transcriptional regulator [Nonomuraea sp. NN258]|uniref:TetR/AcrR family transcriptional regulator n=1 Tax=Nonomuraea antri TaxID=2730852 RepID=UPI0015698C18|nr:TetR/AcrR family transcriptional regulator [Nonomuraea antri]NRQ40202.1 TetR/AcrR family transcriptional regulator [Nonomuraea antri]
MSITAYQQAQQQGQSAVRTALLDIAKHLLVTEGPAALTVRRISAEAGCSTKVIYTLFGGKDGLAEALWLEGFARLEQRLMRLPAESDLLSQLRAGLTAYRAHALAEPEYYRVMFLGALPGFVPGPETAAAAKRTLNMLIDGVQICLDAGVLRGATAVELAEVLWMAMHGAVSLELSGFFVPAEGEQRYELLCSSVLSPFLPTDERNRTL